MADVGEDFVDRVAGDRPGERPAAEQELNHSIQGALNIMCAAGSGLAPYTCCPCLIADLARAVEGHEAFTPGGSATSGNSCANW